MMTEKTMLIVDDIDIDREILAEVFKSDYNIIEAGNGIEAIDIISGDVQISAVLLDLIMPGMDGLGVLREMNRTNKIKDVPVFLITAVENTEMLQEGYDLGAIDVITKPFLTRFLRCRVNNVVELYEHRNKLEKIVKKQVERFQEMNHSVVEVLASIIEFRDMESGEHVRHMCRLTRLLMTEVSNMYVEYRLSDDDIEKIVTSSVLHDIGKISIPDKILNKPGKLTCEEFEIMKQHTVKGCEILRRMVDILDNETYNYSYDICRHHHERWDGKGYPDGLRGDDIPIWVQVVSVADVYDALTSKRVYKDAYSRETAVKMIMNGECGAFNPKVLKAFENILDQL